MLKLEYGKKYIANNGKIYGPLTPASVNCWAPFPFRDEVLQEMWREDGTWPLMLSHIEGHPMNLVREAIEPSSPLVGQSELGSPINKHLSPPAVYLDEAMEAPPTPAAEEVFRLRNTCLHLNTQIEELRLENERLKQYEPKPTTTVGFYNIYKKGGFISLSQKAFNSIALANERQRTEPRLGLLRVEQTTFPDGRIERKYEEVENV